MITKILLLIVWLIVVVAMWVFATSTTISNREYKRYEFWVRSFFYWLAAIASFVIGILI